MFENESKIYKKVISENSSCWPAKHFLKSWFCSLAHCYWKLEKTFFRLKNWKLLKTFFRLKNWKLVKNIFQIEEATGEARVMKSLDRETQPRYSLVNLVLSKLDFQQTWLVLFYHIESKGLRLFITDITLSTKQNYKTYFLNCLWSKRIIAKSQMKLKIKLLFKKD